VSAVLLSHCYRSHATARGSEEPSSSDKTQRNYTYIDGVQALLGRKQTYICGALECLYL
jgi:hypothetical protein